MLKAVFTGALVFVVAAMPAAAQETRDVVPGYWAGSVGGGVAIPMGDAKDLMGTGWGIAASIGYRPENSNISWLLDAMWSRHENKLLDGDHLNNLTVMARAN